MNLNPTVEESLDSLAADILSSAHIKSREVIDPEWKESGTRIVNGNYGHKAWCARTRLHDQEWISPEELNYQLDQINRAISKAQENGLIIFGVARVKLDACDGHTNPKFTPDDIGKFYFVIEAVDLEHGKHKPDNCCGSNLPTYVKSTKATGEVVYKKNL